MSFINDLNSEFLEDIQGIKLNESLSYYSELADRVITVPIGFECDGASIPQPLWSVLGSPLQPRVVDAAVIHDYIYGNRFDLSRKVCDKIFYEAMRSNGVGGIKARLFYAGVRVGGASHRKVDE